MGDKRSGYDRRQVLKYVLIGGVATAVVMPSKWVKPVVNAVIPPAHAAASAPATTKPGTSTTTTTPAPTTTKTATGTLAPSTTTFTKGQTGPALNTICDTNIAGGGQWVGQAIDSKTLYCGNGGSNSWILTMP
jgi:hypothetical protein